MHIVEFYMLLWYHSKYLNIFLAKGASHQMNLGDVVATVLIMLFGFSPPSAQEAASMLPCESSDLKISVDPLEEELTPQITGVAKEWFGGEIPDGDQHLAARIADAIC